MGKDSQAGVPAGYSVKKCAWASKDLAGPTAVNQPKCLPSVGLGGVPMLSDLGMWAESRFPVWAAWGLAGVAACPVAAWQGMILEPSLLPSGVGFVPTLASVCQHQR